MILLNGYIFDARHPDHGPIQQLFTPVERATAFHVAQQWAVRGWQPKLLSKTAEGQFKRMR